MLDEDKAPEDEEDLTPEEKAEREHQEFVRMADASLDRFRATHSEAQQQFIVDAYVATGEIPTGEDFGIDPVEVAVVEHAFASHIERNVLSVHGLSMSDYMEHVDPNDYQTLRRAAAKGDWHVFHDHAQAVAAARKDGSAFSYD
ncbi:MAG: hypothetical protein ACTHOP_25235 [Mesorhizobium sp.]